MASDRREAMGSWIIPVLLVGAAVWAYRHSFGGPFIFDDLNTIVANDQLGNPDSLAAMFMAPTNTSASGRPLVELTIYIDYRIAGLNVGVYHATNLLIHIACGLALWGVLRRTMRRVPALAARADGLAGMVTLIWIVHPIQTGAVTYIVQRGESLASLMMMLTVYAFLRSVESTRASKWWQIAATLACAAGMACKEMMVATPILVLAYDRAFVGGSWRATLRERWTFYAALAATWSVLFLLMASGPRAQSAGFGIQIHWLDYARTQFAVIAHYIRLMFWPRPLILDYSWPLATTWGEVPIGSAMVVSGIVVATLAGVWFWPRWSVLGLWFLGVLAPTSSVVPLLDAAFEHRMYLPSAAMIVAVVVGLALASDAVREHWGIGWKARDKRGHAISAGWAITAIAAVGLMYMTDQRNLDYRSSLSIWTDNITKRPENPRGHFNLSRAMEAAGDYSGAIEQMRTAVDLSPQYFDAVERLGILLATHDAPAAAIEYYTQQLTLHPEWDGGWFALGVLQRRQGNLAESTKDFQQVIDRVPGTPQAVAARAELAEIGRQ